MKCKSVLTAALTCIETARCGIRLNGVSGQRQKDLRVCPMRHVNAEKQIARTSLDVITLLRQCCLHAVPCVQSKVCAKLTKLSENTNDVFYTKASKAC